jgi:hypothetical protein
MTDPYGVLGSWLSACTQDPAFAGAKALEDMEGPGDQQAFKPVRQAALPRTTVTSILHEAEAAQVLRDAFKVVDPDSATIPQLTQRILDDTNYQVLNVYKIDSPLRRSMFEHFAVANDIPEPCTVYHGTTSENAEKIAAQGWHGRLCSNGKYGRGIYAASNPFYALAYAEPDSGDFTQTLFVASLLKGPTTVGSLNLTNFGVDEEDRPILTTTNEDGTIFCAGEESQLLATFMIKARFDVSRRYTEAVRGRIGFLHAKVKEKVMLTAGIAWLPATSAVKLLPKHKGFAVGARVGLQKLGPPYSAFHGKHGTVRQIVQGRKVVFYVEVDGEAQAVAQANMKNRPALSLPTGAQPGWLPCVVAQLVDVVQNAGGSVLGKRALGFT